MSAAFKVLISDPLPEEANRILEESPQIEVITRSEGYDDLLPKIHGWVVRSGTQIGAAELDRCPELKCVCRAGAGVDNVDVKAARERGVVVMNTPGVNARAAGELTIALVMSLARNIPFAHARLADGGWDRSKFVGIECRNRRLGILGLGRVGRHVAAMARGLEMEVFGFDPQVNNSAAADLGVKLATVDEILAECDFVALHTPLNDATRNLINSDSLARSKKGIFLINCSRGGVIDNEALLAALDSGQVGGAALDVFDPEPLPADSKLRAHPKIILTPHLGASTREAQLGVATQSAQQVRDFLEQGTAINVVEPKG